MFTTLPLLLAPLTPAAVLPPQDEAQQETFEIPADTEIVTTDSGLQYSILKAGSGDERPAYGDRVKVHYTGWLTDGTLFDSSRQRGEPSEFAVARVVAGWTEALQLMRVGDRLKLTIPAELGYGAEGSPPTIPPGATLIFDVELLAITARTLPFVPWSDADVEQTADGLSYKKIGQGQGLACSESELVVLEFAMYDADGKPTVSSPMEGAPLVGSPTNLRLEFMAELMPLARMGDHFLVQVPSAKMSLLAQHPAVEPDATYLWQVKIAGAYKFEKPAFRLPGDDELITTDSGLKYLILREGSGRQPTGTNSVKAHYAGWLTDGTQFDASYDRGTPLDFGLRGVIAGWTEGLQLMRVGAKYLFVIPGELAYGARGRPGIPPDATLVFVVELVDVR